MRPPRAWKWGRHTDAVAFTDAGVSGTLRSRTLTLGEIDPLLATRRAPLDPGGMVVLLPLLLIGWDLQWAGQPVPLDVAAL